MGVPGLTKEQETVLTLIVLNRAMLRQCEGSDPSFLEHGQALWSRFGFKSEQEVLDYQVKLLSAIEDQPRLKQVLSQREWYIKWQDGKYYLTYRKSVFIHLLSAVGDSLVAIGAIKEYRWLLVGILVGAATVCAVLNSFLFHRVFVFVIVLGFVGVVTMVGSLWFFDRFVKPLDENSDVRPWGRKHTILFSLLLCAAITISVLLAFLAAGSAHLSSNPYAEDVEQTYP